MISDESDVQGRVPGEVAREARGVHEHVYILVVEYIFL